LSQPHPFGLSLSKPVHKPVAAFDKLRLGGWAWRALPCAPPFGLSLSKPGHKAVAAFDKLRLIGWE
jgi:hypothetical protein